MLIEDLRAYGVVPSVLHAVRKTLLHDAERGPQAGKNARALLPLQEQAVRRGVLSEDSRHLVLLGTAGSGKTVLAKLLALHAMHGGQRVLLLTATEAQARTLRSQLIACQPQLAALGLALAPAACLQDGFRSTPESARPLDVVSVRQLLRTLRRRSTWLQTVDLIVLDGLEALLLTQRRRSMGRLVRAVRGPGVVARVVAFCQQAAQALAIQDLAQPLGADLLLGDAPVTPPVQICSRAQLMPDDAVVSSHGEQRADPDGWLTAFLVRGLREGTQSLAVIPQRGHRLRVMERLLEELDRAPRSDSPGPGAAGLAELSTALAQTMPGRAQQLLQTALRHGIALDSEELTPAQRLLIRRAWTGGLLDLTLAARAPAQTDAQLQQLVWVGPRTDLLSSMAMTDPVPPSLSELMRQAPRLLSPTGQIVVVARTQRAAQRMKQTLRQAHEGEPSSGAWPGRQPWQSQARLAPFVRFLADGLRREIAPLEALTLVALSGSPVPMPLLLSERAKVHYPSVLLNRAAALRLEDRPLFRWLRAEQAQLSHEAIRALKGALLLDLWLSGQEAAVLERQFHVWLGWLGPCARTFARRLRALRKLCRARHGQPQVSQRLDHLITQLCARPLDCVVTHAPPPLQRHVGRLLGALYADTPPSRLSSRR